MSRDKPRYELLRFDEPKALAEAAATEWLRGVPPASNPSLPFLAALSGGRIAREFFKAVTDVVKSRRISLDDVHFFWGDERCVPPSDPESNYRLAKELVLEPLAVPEGQIHRILGEVEPQTAADEAARELCRLAPRSPEDQPVLDLIFLGLGENGHTASLFPGEPEAVMTSPAVFRPVVASKPPPRRITIGYPAIAAARQVWVLASGPGKEQALKDSLAPGALTPLGRILSLRSWTRIFTDIGR